MRHFVGQPQEWSKDSPSGESRRSGRSDEPAFHEPWWRQVTGLLRKLGRSRWVFWSGTVALALLSGHSFAATGTHTRTRRAVVMVNSVAQGVVVGSNDVRIASLSATNPLPKDAARAVEDVVGRALKVPLAAGEVVRIGRLADAKRRGISVRLQRNQRAVAIPTRGMQLGVAVGDLVDVMASVGGVDGNTTTRIVAEQAEVLEVTAERVSVGVRQVDVSAVVNGLVAGTVTVVIR